MWILLVFLGLYIAFFCVDAWTLDPIEIEMIGFALFVLLGIGLSWLLRKWAQRIPPIFFWILFLLYLFTFTLPALVSSCIIILYMTAG
jgi:hypothetical protein